MVLDETDVDLADYYSAKKRIQLWLCVTSVLIALNQIVKIKNW